MPTLSGKSLLKQLTVRGGCIVLTRATRRRLLLTLMARTDPASVATNTLTANVQLFLKLHRHALPPALQGNLASYRVALVV